MKVMTNTKWEASRFKRELTCQSSVTYENNKLLITWRKKWQQHVLMGKLRWWCNHEHRRRKLHQLFMPTFLKIKVSMENTNIKNGPLKDKNSWSAITQKWEKLSSYILLYTHTVVLTQTFGKQIHPKTWMLLGNTKKDPSLPTLPMISS